MSNKRKRTEEISKCNKTEEIHKIIEEIVLEKIEKDKKRFNREECRLKNEITFLKRRLSELEVNKDYILECYEKTKKDFNTEIGLLIEKINKVYCVSCDDCTNMSIKCSNGHSNCSDCISCGLDSYITDQNFATKNPICLKCLVPLDDKDVCKIVEPELWGNFVHERTRMTTQIPKYSNNEENLKYCIKRPCCHRVMADFEGCGVLQCEYCEDSFYCAFCFELFNDSEMCHTHVTNCVHNTEPTYHIISTSQIEALKQCWKNILLEQLSKSVNFDLPIPVYSI